MRLLIAITLLIALTTPAYAEWTKVVENARATVYRDYTTVEKHGELRRVWILADLKQRDRYGALSWRTQEEYDCTRNRWHIVKASLHSEQMGAGEVLGSEVKSTQWREVRSESPMGQVLRELCQ